MRVLPADIYDTLEFSALAFGGIGAGPIFTYGPRAEPCPVCAHGHLQLADGSDAQTAMNRWLDDEGVSATLIKADIWGRDSDLAVEGINLRRDRRNIQARVTFEEWCAALDVVRGT